MNLITSVLHVHERAVVAVEELGVATSVSVVAYCLFEEEMLVAIAGKDSVVGNSLGEEGVPLKNCLEIHAEIGVLVHNKNNFRS